MSAASSTLAYVSFFRGGAKLHALIELEWSWGRIAMLLALVGRFTALVGLFAGIRRSLKVPFNFLRCDRWSFIIRRFTCTMTACAQNTKRKNNEWNTCFLLLWLLNARDWLHSFINQNRTWGHIVIWGHMLRSMSLNVCAICRSFWLSFSKQTAVYVCVYVCVTRMHVFVAWIVCVCVSVGLITSVSSNE